MSRRNKSQGRVTQSMSHKGICYDNTPIKSFVNLMKREYLNRIRINNIDELIEIVVKYIHLV
jgi:putative transposase